MKKLRILLAALVTAMIVTVTAQAQMRSGTRNAANGTPVYKYDYNWTPNDNGSFHHTLTITPIALHVRITNITCNGAATGLGFESMPNSAGGPGGAQILSWDDAINTDIWKGHIQWANAKTHKDQIDPGGDDDQSQLIEDSGEEDGSLTDDEG